MTDHRYENYYFELQKNENTVGTYKKKTMHLFQSNGQMV